MRTFLFCVVTTTALFLLACDVVPAGNPYDPETPLAQQALAAVDVMVTSAADGAGLSDASVVLTPADAAAAVEATTDADGAAALAELAPGAYVLSIVHPTHLRATLSVELVAGELRTVAVGLQAINGLVDDDEVGHLFGFAQRESELGRPEADQDHSGIVVEITDVGARTVTSTEGRFDLFLQPGSYSVRLSAAEHAAAEVSGVALSAGAETELPGSPLVLSANPGVVSGNVQLEAAADHAGALITIGAQTAQSDSAGAFTLTNLPAGSHTLVASKDGFDSVERAAIEVRGGRTTDVGTFELSLSRGHVVGRVELSGESDHSGVTIGLTGTTWTAVSNAAGGFALEGIDLGVYELTARNEGFVTGVVGAVDVQADATSDVGVLALARQLGDFELNGGAAYTNDRSVSVVFVVQDAVEMRVSEDRDFLDSADGDTAYVTFAADSTFNLTDLDGSKIVFAQFTDADGTESPVFSSSITLDRAPPYGASVAINGGAAFSNNADGLVTLALSALDDISGLDAMRLANDGVFDTVVWEPWVTTKVHTLADPMNEGLRSVSLEVRDRAGNVVAVPVENSITLDREDPQLTSFALGCRGTSPAAVCNTPAVEVHVQADDAVEMALSNDQGFVIVDWRALAGSSTWFLPPGDGPKTVYLRLRDAAGNVSETFEQSLTLDETAPVLTSVELAAGGDYTNAASPHTVALALLGSGATQMQVAVDGVPDTETWQPWAAASTVNLPTGDGQKLVAVRARDDAGNTTTTVVDVVLLDTEAPSISALVIEGRNAAGVPTLGVTATLDVDLLVGTSGATLLAVDTSPLDCALATYDVAVATRLPFTLTGAGTVSLCARDAAGNTVGPVAANITVDTSPPSCTVSLAGLRADGTAAPANQTASRTVTVRSTCSGNPQQMALVPSGVPMSCDLAAYTSYSATSSVFVSSGDGAKNVLACYRDAVGNYTASPATASPDITLDQTPPSSPSVSVSRDGLSLPASVVPSEDVDAFPSATSAAQMMVAATPNFSGASWVSYGTAAVDVSLPSFSAALCSSQPGGVTRTVFARFRDSLRNVSAVATYSLTMDLCDPPQPTVVLRGSPGAFSSQYVRDYSVAASVGMNSAVDATGLRVAQLNGTGACPAVSSMAQYDLTPSLVNTFTSDGAKRVCVALEDDSGRTSTAASDTITVDTTPPGAPSLAPSNTVGANNSCARIQPSGASDANFWKWQKRSQGSAWSDTSLISGRVDFTLLQDTNNLLEVRAVDRAGNVGESNSSFVEEVSSTLVQTRNRVKHACGNGRYLILKSEGWPTHTGYAPLTLPDVELLDLATMSVVQLSGPDGLLAGVGLTEPEGRFTKLTDAACDIDSSKLLITYTVPEISPCAIPGGVCHTVFWGVIADPLAPIGLTSISPSDLPLNNDGAGGLDTSLGGWDTTDVVYFTGANIYALTRYAVAFFGTDHYMRAVHYTGGAMYYSTRISEMGADDFVTRRIGLGLDRVGSSPNYTFNLAYLQWQENVNAANDDRWAFLRRSTAGTETRHQSYWDYWGFDIDHPPYRTLVHPAHQRHYSTGVEETETVLWMDPEIGEGRGFSIPANSSVNLGSSNQSGDWLTPIADTGTDRLLWFDPNAKTGEIRRGATNPSDFDAPAETMDLRYPVDQSLPVVSTGKTALGQPIVAYHTRGLGAPEGVVIGYRDESGCVQ